MIVPSHTIEFHIAAKTPLRNLANSVRWLEESAKHATGGAARKSFNKKAKAMRMVVSAVYAHREIAGEYSEPAQLAA